MVCSEFISRVNFAEISLVFFSTMDACVIRFMFRL